MVPVVAVQQPANMPIQSVLDKTLSAINKVSMTVGNVLTFGMYSQAFDGISQAVNEGLSDGWSVKRLASLLWQFGSGITKTAVGGLATGVAAAELAMLALAPVQFQKQFQQYVADETGGVTVGAGNSAAAQGVSNAQFTSHALESMQADNLTNTIVNDVLQNGAKYIDTTNQRIVFWKDGVQAVYEPWTNVVVTVFRNSGGITNLERFTSIK